jgi:transcriptional antiterminator NusG
VVGAAVTRAGPHIEQGKTAVAQEMTNPSESVRTRRRRRAEGAEAPGVATVEQEGKNDQPHWYVIHTYSGYENKVKKNLEQRVSTLDMADKIFEIVVPTEEEIEIRNGQRHTVQRKVFPGYVLVKMVMSDDSWYVVRNTPGVTSFVGMGNKPTPLGDPEVQAIIKQMAAEAPRVKVTLGVGQAVRIIDGPFADFQGLIDEINQEKGKVKVLVSFFGRETPVELDFLQVEKLVK